MSREEAKAGVAPASALGLAALLIAWAAIAWLAAPAGAADTAFCPPGEEAGQCDGPEGVAVNEELKRLYVLDQGNRRVEVFDAESEEFLFAFGWGVDTGAEELERCTAASGCQKGLSGSGAGQLVGSARSIAIDNVEGSEGKGQVYVFNGSNLRVEVYDEEGEFLFSFGEKGTGPGQFNSFLDMVAVGPGGVVYVGATPDKESEGFNPRVELFDHEGSFLGECELAHKDRLSQGLAVDGEGDLYAAFNKGGGIFKFEYAEPECPQILEGGVYPLEGEEKTLGNKGLAIDGEGGLFAGQLEPRANPSGSHSLVAHYDAAGEILRRYGYDSLEGVIPFGVAPFPPASGAVFASDQGPFGIRHLEEGEGPVVPDAGLQTATVRSVWAEIESEINPEGEPTGYRIAYVDRESFEEEGFAAAFETEDIVLEDEEGEAIEDFRVHAANLLAGCKPFSEEALEEGACLAPETEYLYRVVAEHEDETEDQAEGTFTTRPPLEVEALFAAKVGTDSATLRARVNPLGSEASGHFEYVELSQYEASGFEGATQVPDTEGGEAPIAFGAGEEGVLKGALATGLKEGTAYRYRVVLTDPFASFEDQERTLTTLRAGGIEPCPGNEDFRDGASGALPDCRAYEMVSPLDKEGGDIKLVGAEESALEQSALSGSRVAYGTYRAFGDAASAPFTSQYVARRDAAAGSWVSHGILPQRERPLTIPSEQLQTELKELSPDLCEAWIQNLAEPPLAPEAVPGYFNLYRRSDDECGGPAYEALTTVPPPAEPPVLNLTLQGVGAEGTKGIFLADEPLAAGASAGVRQLYGTEGGELRFLCVLPGGAPHTGPCTAGRTANFLVRLTHNSTVKDALSEDATRLYWGDGDAAARLYLRENPFAEGPECAGAGSPCTVAVSADGEALSGTEKSDFWAAAPDGSAALYVTADLEAGVSDLYRYDAAAGESRRLARKVDGVAGQSEDLRKVYFVSREEIEGSEGATEGKPNLYLYEQEGEGEGSYRFIATVAESDADPEPQGTSTAVGIEPEFKSSRVSPDGNQIAFMSAASLTGYDNAEVEEGGPAAEVYRYDASAAGGEGQLRCLSCNPSGARPVAERVGTEAHPGWIAAQIPGWKTNLYASRALSEDGRRVFFESFDALVARDTNSHRDVYQWEAAGKGGCDGTDPSFVATAGGCVDLISSGQSEIDSRFLDASPSGNDVFFITLSSLVPSDYGLADVYDARANGGLPSPPPPAPECEGEGCQPQLPAPPAPAPSSLGYAGPGNLAAPKKAKKNKRRCAKGKRKVRRKGKVRCAKKKAGRRHARHARRGRPR